MGNLHPETSQQETFIPGAQVAESVGRAALQDTEARTENVWTAERYAATATAMQGRLDIISVHVPEVAEEAESITRGAAELIETFRLRPELFDDTSRSTIFVSLAYANGKLQEARKAGEQNPIELERQRRFIGNATFLLTRDYADAFPELIAQHNAERGANDDRQVKRILDKYEQPELTRALVGHIEGRDILTDLREKLGKEEEPDPTYHVLAIGTDPGSYFEKQGNGLTWEEAKAWSDGVNERTRQFAEEFPEGTLASRSEGFAFDVQAGDNHDHAEHHIYIPMASAELVMADEREVTPSKFMVDTDKAKRVVGTIRHEFVHTKGSVNVGDAFGKSLEERRAEYFSGDTSEYYEVKTFFRHLQLLNNKYVGDMFEEVAKARHDEDAITIYEVIARDYGLGSVAEIAAAQPDAYVRHGRGSVFTRNMLQALGGYSAIIERAAKNGYVDKDMATANTIRVINNLRSQRAEGEEINAEFEEFVGSYFSPVLNALGMSLADVPYKSPASAPEQAN